MALKNIKRYVQAVRQNNGILKTDQIQLPTETLPADSDLAVGRIYCDGSTIYGYNGSSFVDMLSSASYNIAAWNDIYDLDSDKTLDIDAGTLTFNLTGATDGLTMKASAAATTGALLQFDNAGAAADVQGTSDTWSVSKAGAAVFNASVTSPAIVAYHAGADGGLTIDAKGTGTIAIGATSTGAVTITPALTATASITITGTTATDVLTVTDGDINLSDGSLTIVDVDDATTLSITNDTADGVNVVDINADAIAAGGVILHLDSTAADMSTGLFFECYDGAASAFSIGLYGKTTIAGNAATDVFLITNGDMVGSDTSLTLTDADNAATLSVTNNTATTEDVVVFAGSGAFTGDSFVGIAPSGLTSGSALGITCAALTSGEAILISTNAITTGNAVKITNTGEAITSGELLTISNAEDGDLATKTGNLVSITSVMDETGNTDTQNYDTLLVSRTDEINVAEKTYTAQGSVAKILHTSTKTQGTALTDTVIGLEVEMSGATALGHAVQITNVGVTGSALNVVSANVGASDVLITSSGAHTDGFAGLHVVVTGNVAAGGAALYLEQKTGTATADSRMFEIVGASDMRAVYIDVDSVTNDCVYIQSDGNLAAGKAVLHVNNGGAPAADNCYVGHFSYDGAATNESAVLFADGGGKDVTGLLVDCDPAYAADNLSGHITLFSDAAGDLPVIMNFYHDDAGAASGEYCAKMFFYGHDDADAKELYGSIEVEQDDASAANPDGVIWIKGNLQGTNTVSAGFIGNKVMLGAAAATLTTAGAWDLTVSTNGTAANEPRIVLTDGANGDITITAGATAGDVVLNSPFVVEESVGVTADVGSAQGNGAFTETFLEIATVGTTGDAVTLPAAEAGKIIIITNRGANAADVFPASGDNINEVGVDTAKALAADKTLLCVGIDATHWEAVLLSRT